MSEGFADAIVHLRLVVVYFVGLAGAFLIIALSGASVFIRDRPFAAVERLLYADPRPTRTVIVSYALALLLANATLTLFVVIVPPIGTVELVYRGSDITPQAWWVAAAVWLLLGSFAIAWAPRCLLLSWSFAAYAATEAADEDAGVAAGSKSSSTLTGTQRRAAARLLAACRGSSPVSPVHATLRGEWGVGKSTVLREFARQLDESATGVRVITVGVNAWELSDPAEVENYIGGVVFKDWHVLRHGGWWLCPRFDGMLAVLRRLRRFEFNVMGTSLSAEGDADSQLPLQKADEFRRLGACLKRMGTRLVVIIDEVDRCEGLVAQAVLNVTVRSLLAPGIGAIVVRVPHQMRDKTISPWRESLADIDGSNMAVIAAHFLKYAVGRGQIESETLKLHTGIETALASRLPSRAIQLHDRNRELLSQHIDLRLIEYAASLPTKRYESLAARFSERLTPGATVDLGGLTEDDIVELIERRALPTVNDALDSWDLGFTSSARMARLVAIAVMNAWSAKISLRDPLTPGDPLPVRTFERWVNSVISASRPSSDEKAVRFKGFLVDLFVRCPAA